jgi:hypothetical protein
MVQFSNDKGHGVSQRAPQDGKRTRDGLNALATTQRVPEEFDPRLRRDITCTYGDGLVLPLATGLCDIDRIFEENDRIIVSKSDRPAATLHNRFCDLLRRSRILNAIKIPGFVDAAGLLAYGPNIPDLWRRAADSVDKICEARTRATDTRIAAIASISADRRGQFAGTRRRRCLQLVPIDS